MAASMWRMNGLWGRMAGVLVLCTLLLSNEVMCQDVQTPPTASPPATNQPALSSAAPDNGASGTTPGPTLGASPSAAGPQLSRSTSQAPNPPSNDKKALNTDNNNTAPDISDTNQKSSAPLDSSEVDKTKTSSSSVFVGILVTGLLAALALIVGYFKCQRKPETKGGRLAEEAYPVDQENQGNTLESVAPLNLPPESQEKPSVNGESPEAAKTQPPPPTNGHSTAKTADTEL